MDLTVWPVEFYSIVEEMKVARWPKPQFNDDRACGFLDADSGCQIYPFRPIICRTHGLPLVYWHEDSDPPGYGVIFCDKNFEAGQEIEFTPDNTLDMDKINEKLARVNLVFLDERKDLSLEAESRIELRKLLDYL
jgi:Fe-S-cluster containining protein